MTAETSVDEQDDSKSRRQERRAAQNELSREHVLDAAEDVFSKKGFHDASIKEIAQVSEFSVGAVYSFFDNKDDLFIKVMERRGAELVPAMAELLGVDSPPSDQLHALADLQVGFFREHPRFARLFVRATGAPLLNIKASIGDATRARYDEAMTLQADLFSRGQEDGTLRPGDPAVLAGILSGIMLAFQTHDEPLRGDRADTDGFGLDELHALLDRTFVS
jgi:TetR/AcrR family transcriptional regulator